MVKLFPEPVMMLLLVLLFLKSPVELVELQVAWIDGVDKKQFPLVQCKAFVYQASD